MIEGPRCRAAGPPQTNEEEVEKAELKSLSVPWAPLLQIGKVSLKFRSTNSLGPSFFLYPGRTLHMDLASWLAARLVQICATSIRRSIHRAHLIFKNK